MSDYSFDANIVIDALLGFERARSELKRATSGGARAWLSRMAWIEVMSTGAAPTIRETEYFLSGFAIDEIDKEVADRAAGLRRERPGLRLSDAIILATALVKGRILVTRNTNDFPATMPGVRVPYIL